MTTASKPASEAGTEATSTFHAYLGERAEDMRPGLQLSIANRCGWKHEHAQAAAELVQGNGDMVIVVSIDSKCDEDLRRLAMAIQLTLARLNALPNRSTSMSNAQILKRKRARRAPSAFAAARTAIRSARSAGPWRRREARRISQ
jgi:hypothetical protein